MLGFSPRAYSLTPRQVQFSAEVSEVVPELPTTLCDLISQMAMPDFTLAMQPLEMDGDGEVMQNQRNKDIIAIIELAITSSSTECSPTIKAQIFINATDKVDLTNYDYIECQFGGLLRNYLAQILKELKHRGELINLDDVLLNDLDMSRTAVKIDLSGMSAKRATFNTVSMKYFKLNDVDFTGAVFINSSLEQAEISNAIVTGATFTNVSFRNTIVCELTCNQSAIFEASRTSSEFAILRGAMIVRAENTYLSGINVTAAPDTGQFILPAKKIIIPALRKP